MTVKVTAHPRLPSDIHLSAVFDLIEAIVISITKRCSQVFPTLRFGWMVAQSFLPEKGIRIVFAPRFGPTGRQWHRNEWPVALYKTTTRNSNSNDPPSSPMQRVIPRGCKTSSLLQCLPSPTPLTEERPTKRSRIETDEQDSPVNIHKLAKGFDRDIRNMVAEAKGNTGTTYLLCRWSCLLTTRRRIRVQFCHRLDQNRQKAARQSHEGLEERAETYLGRRQAPDGR